MKALIALLLIVVLVAGCGPTTDNNTDDNQETGDNQETDDNQDTNNQGSDSDTSELNESLVSDPGEVEIGEMI